MGMMGEGTLGPHGRLQKPGQRPTTSTVTSLSVQGKGPSAVVRRNPWLRPTPDYRPVERLWNASLSSEASGTGRFRTHSSGAPWAQCVRMFGCVTTRCTGQFGVGGTIPIGVSRCWVAHGPVNPTTEDGESEGAAEQGDEADEA